MKLTSTAFGPGASIPARFAMRAVPAGENASIPYSWSGAPSSVKSFALVLVDHSPIAHEWVHWMVTDIPGTVPSLPEGASRTAAMGGAREHDNTFGTPGYGGPQPPPGSGRHPYDATVYALDVPQLGLPEKTTLAQFEHAIAGHVVARGTYSGFFGR